MDPQVVDRWTDEQFNLRIGSFVVRKREELRAQRMASEKHRSDKGGEGVSRGPNGGTVETKRFNAWDVMAEPYPGSGASTADDD